MKTNNHSRTGFTLVEIMVVVVIIGLLATLSIPAMQRARTVSLATAIASNFRIYAQAFEVYAIEEGTWPPDSNHGIIPTGMEGQLPRFTDKSSTGGFWDWEYKAMGVTAGVSLLGSTAGVPLLQKIDEILDDGNLLTGHFIDNGNRVTLILEP